MNFAEFSQFSPLVATIFIIWFTIKYFTEAVRKKDEQIVQMVKDFNHTIDNHLKHSTDALLKLEQAILELTKQLKENGKS